MKPIPRNTTLLTQSMVGRSLAVTLCLLFWCLAGLTGFGQSSDCSRQAAAVRDVDLMEQPPTYSTKHGWIYGNRIGAVPRGARVQICEERVVGFLGSKQLWYRIRWESRQGWIDSSGVQGGNRSQSGLLHKIEASLFPVAFAESDFGAGPSSPPLQLGSFLFLILGMIAKSIFDISRKDRLWIGVRGFFTGLIPSLVISPMIFLSFLKTADLELTSDLSLWLIFLFAFQNGFFWKDVLSRGQSTESSPAAKKHFDLQDPLNTD